MFFRIMIVARSHCPEAMQQPSSYPLRYLAVHHMQLTRRHRSSLHVFRLLLSLRFFTPPLALLALRVEDIDHGRDKGNAQSYANTCAKIYSEVCVGGRVEEDSIELAAVGTVVWDDGEAATEEPRVVGALD